MKKRSEGFFGLHFDFHAGADCTKVGKDVTEEMIFEIIKTLNPDYIQCDCKGHAGYSSYQTKAGNPAPGFVKDQLGIWRKVTKKYNIPLVVHYSGVWDNRALELNPGWALTNENGSPDKEKISTFGEYADKLLIPQLVELACDYGVDAVWVDGECWAVKVDFNKKVIADFEKEYKIKLNKNDEGNYDKKSYEYKKFLDFNRKQFLKYVGHYAGEVKKTAPDFEVASNWAFSSHMPERVCIDVDYLSGDFSPNDSFNSARFEGRVLCEQGKAWDLMAWGFTLGDGFHSVKGADALCREAAAVISLGGGFQIYNTQNRDGSVRLWEVRELLPVSQFMREREEFLKGCEPFSDIGILYSDYDMKNRNDSLFFPGGKAMAEGAVRLFLDAALPCGILMDYMLESENKKFSEKNIIVVPELRYINEDIKEKLLKFAENGGNLIISGYECCKIFADVLEGVEIFGNCSENVLHVSNGERIINQKSVYGEIKVGGNSEILRKTNENKPIITKTKYKKGTITAIYYDIFELYCGSPDFYARNMISEIIENLQPERSIVYKGQKFVDIIPAKKDGKLLINLINTSGIYTEGRLKAYDEIQTLTDLEITVKLEKAPKSIKLQPEDKVPQSKYDAAAKKLTVSVEKLQIHSIITIHI